MSAPESLSQLIARRPQRIALLQHVAEQGSITRAAKAAGLSYKAAWDAIDALNNLAPMPLVVRSTGGRGGGGAQLSAEGVRVLQLYQRLQALQAQFLEAADGQGDLDLLGRLMLRTSARNQLHGEVLNVQREGIHDRVRLRLGAEVTLEAIITHDSTEQLELQPGRAVVALIKAGWVRVAAPGAQASPSDNCLSAKLETLPERGTDAELCELRLSLASGQTLCAAVSAAEWAQGSYHVGDWLNVHIDPAHVLLGVTV